MANIVPKDERFGALDELLGEEEAGFNPQPVTMKVSHQTGEFTLPGLPASKEAEGIILSAMKIRVFYPSFFKDKDKKAVAEFMGRRALCRSSNYSMGEMPDLDWGEAPEQLSIVRAAIAHGELHCAKCPLNKWGSIELLDKDVKKDKFDPEEEFTSGRKACAEKRRLLFWRPGIRVPVIVLIPSSSIRNWDSYCSSLEVGSYRYQHVFTKMTLDVREGPAEKYSIYNFAMVDVINDAIVAELSAAVSYMGGKVPLAKALVSQFRRETIDIEEYVNGFEEEKETTDF